MDFIERFFGVSPDGGDGSAELMIVAAIVIVLAGVAAARMPRLRAYVRGLFGPKLGRSISHSLCIAGVAISTVASYFVWRDIGAHAFNGDVYALPPGSESPRLLDRLADVGCLHHVDSA